MIKERIDAINKTIAKLIYKRVIAKESALIIKKGEYTTFMTVESITKWINENDNIVASPIKREINYWSEKYYDSKDLHEMLKWYCGYKNENINHFLRTKNPLHTWNSKFEIEDTKEYISKIDSEMQRRMLHHNILAVRWVHLKNIQKCLGWQLAELRPGLECIDHGYMSTSLYLPYIGGYDEMERDISKEILILLKLPIGNHGIYIRKDISDREEYEYLVSRSTPFVIEKIYHKFFRPFIIVCQVLK
ncbi:ADP-ribosyltransferase [Bacteroides thetaiotaomicron]|uniref:ADP-ribosyltransferase n=1 Tax=Bacteroides thetaiotaomicron TaxID=818 RepID=UPI0039C2F872